MTRGFITFVVVAVSAILAVVVAALFRSPLIVPPVLVFLVGAFVLQGIRLIPANPPHKGAETYLKKRTGRFVDEGLRFFPFFPFLFGFIPVDVEKKNVNLDGDRAQLVRAPDMAEVKVPVHYTYTPVDLVMYLNSGGESGVENILSDIIAQELRVWGVKSLVNRNSWKDLVRAGNSAVRDLIRAVTKAGGFTPTTGQVNDVSNGTATLLIPNLGIALNRLNVGEIEPTGEVAKAAEKAAKERSEREAEVVELEHINDRVIELMKPLPDGPGLTAEQAIELIQTERKKVVKTINRKDYGLAPDTLNAILAHLIPGKEGGDE